MDTIELEKFEGGPDASRIASRNAKVNGRCQRDPKGLTQHQKEWQ
jgi:hypothetical protein